MTAQTINRRLESLRELLNHERNITLARIKEYRDDQEQEALPAPSDELDAARSLSDVETHASLIERAEERLRAIDFAFNLIEQGRYGVCAQCGDEIPLERLKALPFAAYCVECQRKRNHARRLGEGTLDEPFAHQWSLPEEIDESLEKQDSLTEPEEQIMVHEREAFGPEIGEFEQLPPVSTARRRGRAKKREQTEE